MNNSQIAIFLSYLCFYNHETSVISLSPFMLLLQWFSCVKTNAFDPMGADELLPWSEHKHNDLPTCFR